MKGQLTHSGGDVVGPGGGGGLVGLVKVDREALVHLATTS